MDVILKKLQTAELYIAKEVKRICMKNQIQYTLVGGTLIGAVRHKGFIPWDDDMDFVMTRDNFNKFAEACKNDLSDEFVLQNWHIDPYYGYPFIKIHLKGTKATQAVQKHSKCRQNIFIDIFPFDRIPDEKYKRFSHFFKTQYYKKLAWLKNEKDLPSMYSGYRKIAFQLLQYISSLKDMETITCSYEKAAEKYKNQITSCYTSIAGIYGYYKEMIPASFFESYVELPFEDTTFMAIAKYDQYLKQVFGDYMQLPPEEKRRSHSIVDLDFGDFFERHPELDVSPE